MYRSRPDEPTTPCLQVRLRAHILFSMFWGCETILLWQWNLFFVVVCLLLTTFFKGTIKKTTNSLVLGPAIHATQMACRNHYWLTPVSLLAVVNYKRSCSSPEAALLLFVSRKSSAAQKPSRVVRQPHSHWVGLVIARHGSISRGLCHSASLRLKTV